MTDVLTRLTASLADRYRLERELGAGGMATVYLAHDTKHERDVAIKVLHLDLGAALGADRFLSEIKTTAKLQHPHILPLLDSGAADGLLYYVMPYVRGETLRARLEREKQLPIDDALRIAREVASALEHAHKQGIIHRDIKPENILLQDGAAVVADFGIALAVQSAGGARMTQTGLSLGTPQYMSPEQAMGERSIDARSDIYALGAVTYEMLAGEPPFSGPSTQAIVAKVLNERPVSLRTVRDTVPVAVDNAVQVALAKLPADRHTSARAFADACHTSATSNIEPGEVHSSRRARAVSRRHLLLGIALGAVATALISVAWFVLQPSKRVDDRVTRFAIDEDASRVFSLSLGKSMFIDHSGENFYLLGESDGIPMLWQRPLDMADERVVQAVKNVSVQTAALSIDGKEMLLVDGTHATVSTLATSAVRSRELPLAPGILGLAWMASGAIVATNDSAANLFVIPANGQPAYPIFFAPTGTRLLWPFAVAESDRVVFTALAPNTDSATIMSGSLGTREAKAVGARGVFAVGVVEDLLVTADRDGQLSAARFDVRRGVVTDSAVSLGTSISMALSGVPFGYAVISGRGDLAYLESTDRSLLEVIDPAGRRRLAIPDTLSLDHPRWSPDGSRIAVTVTDRTTRRRQVWLLDIVTGQFSPLLPADRAESDRAAFAPSGKEIIFRRLFDGRTQYFAKSLTGAGSIVPISPATARAFEAEVAPDGQTMLGRMMYQDVTQRLWTWQRGDTLGTTMQRFSDVESFMAGARISPDGRWAVFRYTEVGATAQRQWVTPFPAGGARWQVGGAPGGIPVWGADSRTVFTPVPDGLYAAQLEFGERIVSGPSRKVNAGPFRFEQNARGQLDVARDGSVVYVRPVRGRRIVVVRNFLAEIRARMKKAGS